MIYKYATLGLMALVGTAMTVPASAQSNGLPRLQNPEQAAADSQCVVNKITPTEGKEVSQKAAAGIVDGIEDADPQLISVVERGIKKCAAKARWNDTRKEDAATLSTLIITQSGLANRLAEIGVDNEKLDAWFDAQDDAFKATDVNAMTDKESEKFGLRIIEGAMQSGASSDTISDNMQTIVAYMTMSLMTHQIIS